MHEEHDRRAIALVTAETPEVVAIAKRQAGRVPSALTREQNSGSIMPGCRIFAREKTTRKPDREEENPAQTSRRRTPATPLRPPN